MIESDNDIINISNQNQKFLINESFGETKNNLIEESLNELEFYNFLNYISKFCFTNLGIEKILEHKPIYIKPISELKKFIELNSQIDCLNLEHTLIDEMCQLLIKEDNIPLQGLTDIRQLIYKSRIENSILNSTELLKVKDAIRASRLIKNYFEHRQETYKNLASFLSRLHENRFLEKHISDAIDDSGEIHDNATPELLRIRRLIKEKSIRLRKRLEKILKQVSDEDLLQDDFVTIREGRYVLPVRSEHKRHLSGIIYGVSQTGSTVFIEPTEIIEMNNELSLLMDEEKNEIYKILSNLTKELSREAEQFLESIEILAHLDSLIAKSKYALEFGGIKPKIHNENYLELRAIKHPLLVHSIGKNKVIPLDISFDDYKRGHLISGPNAGGKTVALKSIGLNLAMALSGIFPLGECHTSIRTIFTCIGDHQSIENNLSTFSSQLIKIKDILDNCTKDSLVLIDEIGTGTDPQEGAALAVGIMDTFIKLNLFFVATTHQSSLKTYALNRTEIANASLEFDSRALKPTYRFLQGVPGNSYAFILAKNLGFSDLILDRANKYIGNYQKEIEDSIAALQKLISEAESEKIKLTHLKLKSDEILKKYTEKYNELKEKRKKLLDEAHQEAASILQNANALIENTIREIREEKRSISDIKNDFIKTRKSLEKLIESNHISLGEKADEQITVATRFSEGDYVIMKDTNAEGLIIAVDFDNHSAIVDFNGLKFKLAFEQIQKIDKKEIKKTTDANYLKFDASTTLDIRGKRVDEASKLLDEFISDAILGNIKRINVIHGKGTGALKQIVHENLKYHPSVESFRIGELTEGGAGVTIIELK